VIALLKGPRAVGPRLLVAVVRAVAGLAGGLGSHVLAGDRRLPACELKSAHSSSVRWDSKRASSAEHTLKQ